MRLGAPAGDWSAQIRWSPDLWAWLRLDGARAAERIALVADLDKIEALGAVGLVVVLRAERSAGPLPAARARAAQGAGDAARLRQLGLPAPDCGALDSPGWRAWCLGDPVAARALLREEQRLHPDDPQALARLWLAEGVAGDAATGAAATGLGG